MRIVFIPLMVVAHQMINQSVDGQWYIQAETVTASTERGEVRAIDYSDYRYVEPVGGIRVSADQVNGIDAPIRLVVLFERGSTRLTPEDAERVRRLASAYDTYFVEGHADSTGDAKINLAISRIRAKRVARLLREGGAREISIRAFGETQPVCRDASESCRRKNRRVVIRAMEKEN